MKKKLFFDLCIIIVMNVLSVTSGVAMKGLGV